MMGRRSNVGLRRVGAQARLAEEEALPQLDVEFEQFDELALRLDLLQDQYDAVIGKTAAKLKQRAFPWPLGICPLKEAGIDFHKTEVPLRQDRGVERQITHIVEREANARTREAIEMFGEDGILQVDVGLADLENEVGGESLVLAQEVDEVVDEASIRQAAARDIAEEAYARCLRSSLPNELDAAEEQHVVDRRQQILPGDQRQVIFWAHETPILRAEARKTFEEAPPALREAYYWLEKKLYPAGTERATDGIQHRRLVGQDRGCCLRSIGRRSGGARYRLLLSCPKLFDQALKHANVRNDILIAVVTIRAVESRGDPFYLGSSLFEFAGHPIMLIAKPVDRPPKRDLSLPTQPAEMA